MAYDDYNPADVFSPAMGRVLIDDPESAIDYFVKAGVSPTQFMQFTQLADASNTIVPASPETFIPPSGNLGGPSPYEQPATTPGGEPHLSLSDVIGRAKDFYGPLVGKGIQNMIDYGKGPPTKGPAPPPAKAPDRVPESGPGRVPPSALAKGDEDKRVADEPYTPSTKYATLDTGEKAATPSSDPRKGETEEVSAAKKARDKSSLGDLLSGVKAPPAPPQPVLRPHSERGGAFPTNMPIVQLLSAILSGQGTGPDVLRLSQAIGK